MQAMRAEPPRKRWRPPGRPYHPNLLRQLPPSHATLRKFVSFYARSHHGRASSPHVRKDSTPAKATPQAQANPQPTHRNANASSTPSPTNTTRGAQPSSRSFMDADTQPSCSSKDAETTPFLRDTSPDGYVTPPNSCKRRTMPRVTRTYHTHTSNAFAALEDLEEATPAPIIAPLRSSIDRKSGTVTTRGNRSITPGHNRQDAPPSWHGS